MNEARAIGAGRTADVVLVYPDRRLAPALR